jgi:hypothetical protein
MANYRKITAFPCILLYILHLYITDANKSSRKLFRSRYTESFRYLHQNYMKSRAVLRTRGVSFIRNFPITRVYCTLEGDNDDLIQLLINLLGKRALILEPLDSVAQHGCAKNVTRHEYSEAFKDP